LVHSRKKGLNVFYSLASSDVVTLLNSLRRVAETQLAEVDRLINSYLTLKDDLEPLSANLLLERAQQGLVTVLDVRPAEEYKAGHLPGAINIPLADLENHIHELPPEREVIAYCRGPYCVLAYDAVAKLRRQGFTARRLQDGFPEWKIAGLPVESSVT
jgi:rhodanese-related sulfurtransferase